MHAHRAVGRVAIETCSRFSSRRDTRLCALNFPVSKETARCCEISSSDLARPDANFPPLRGPAIDRPTVRARVLARREMTMGFLLTRLEMARSFACHDEEEAPCEASA